MTLPKDATQNQFVGILFPIHFNFTDSKSTLDMTPEQVTLVKESWEKVKPISEQAAELFYGRLFTLDPSLRALFKGDMSEQGKKLMSTITLAVTSLDRLETILPTVQALGRKHAVEYEVPDSSYATVGEALIWTLGQGLGDDFTEDVKEAWLLTYTTLSGAMLSGKSAAA
ncbi:hemoglobin [Rhodopirellula baltica SH28]|uniref:Hemoglobin n=1 Tax=Rhodopirellula baltica SH28 TaxID=993517 RepID=K5DGW5_RHOBT|nr:MULTISPECIES: globin family protein [Rhodopirellula]EKK01678.1 hemoglobin [Rhodopirellula baltica SH28]